MQQAARHRGAPSTTKTSPSTTTTTIVETLEPFPYSTVNNNNYNSSSSSSSSFLLPLTNMSNGRDRTGEFQTTVKTFASRRVRSIDREMCD